MLIVYLRWGDKQGLVGSSLLLPWRESSLPTAIYNCIPAGAFPIRRACYEVPSTYRVTRRNRIRRSIAKRDRTCESCDNFLDSFSPVNSRNHLGSQIEHFFRYHDEHEIGDVIFALRVDFREIAAANHVRASRLFIVPRSVLNRDSERKRDRMWSRIHRFWK